MTDIRTLVYNVCSSKRGVKPLIEPAHVIKALLLLYEREPMGRTLLSKFLNLGPASVRTLIRRLKEYDLVRVDNVGGCLLTEKGREIARAILGIAPVIRNVSDAINDELKLAYYAWASLIKQGVKIIERLGVVNVRDRIILYGAKAALIVFINEKYAYIPPDTSLNELRYRSLRELKMLMQAYTGDAVIVSFSDNMNIAEKALLNTIADLFLDYLANDKA